MLPKQFIGVIITNDRSQEFHTHGVIELAYNDLVEN